MKRRIIDLLAMMLVGDGVLAFTNPKGHCKLWSVGPKPLRNLMNQMTGHPVFVRSAGVMEAMLGVFLAEAQGTKAEIVLGYAKHTASQLN